MRTNEFQYKNITVTIELLKVQIIDSVPYAREWLRENSYQNPETMFYDLKDRIFYVNDKKGVEQLQSMQTLFSDRDNIHGLSGAGDCDCFTITVTVLSLLLGWKTEIVLAGRSRKYPVHIYNRINGFSFDLTEPFFDRERNYPYKQAIPVSPVILKLSAKREFQRIIKKYY